VPLELKVLADPAEVAGAVADRTQDAAATVARQTRHQVRRLEDRFHENPLAVGAAALAIGAAVGLALPHTAKEDELMGSARDSLMDQARATTDDAINKVKHVADEAKQAVKQTSGDST